MTEDRAKWLRERKKGIGGSDAGAILGVNPYKNAFAVWQDKVSEEIDEAQSEAAYWGTVLEDVVAKEFERQSGKKVRRINRTLVHREYPFIRANIDRDVVGENAILECKTANAFFAKEWEGNEVPASYLVQCQHYLAVTGAQMCYIACLIGGQRYVWKELPRDEELIGMIVKAEKDFWENHVLTGIPPEIDGSHAAKEYLSKTYSRDSGETIWLEGKYERTMKDYLELKAQSDEIKQEMDCLSNQLKNQMKQAQTAISGGFRAEWKTKESKRVDTERFKKEYPEIYQKVLTTTTQRRFTVKEIG